jgi:hypothetical protein
MLLHRPFLVSGGLVCAVQLLSTRSFPSPRPQPNAPFCQTIPIHSSSLATIRAKTSDHTVSNLLPLKPHSLLSSPLPHSYTRLRRHQHVMRPSRLLPWRKNCIIRASLNPALLPRSCPLLLLLLIRLPTKPCTLAFVTLMDTVRWPRSTVTKTMWPSLSRVARAVLASMVFRWTSNALFSPESGASSRLCSGNFAFVVTGPTRTRVVVPRHRQLLLQGDSPSRHRHQVSCEVPKQRATEIPLGRRCRHHRRCRL